MTTTFVVALGKDTIMTALMVVAPVMVVGFVVGITISLVQAIMQIQEMTLTFVPKLVAIGFALVICGHWMLEKLMVYTKNMLGGFNQVIGG